MFCPYSQSYLTIHHYLKLLSQYPPHNHQIDFVLDVKKLFLYHLVFLILFENTEVNKVLTQPSRQLKGIYFKAVAGNFILEKKRIVRELRRAGIYTLLTEPEKLTANTINGYLELKERGVV